MIVVEVVDVLTLWAARAEIARVVRKTMTSTVNGIYRLRMIKRHNIY